MDVYDVENIGRLNYVLSILFGKNRAVRLFSTEKNSKTITKRYLEKDEMIVTISKNFLIVTEVIKEKRMPIIVKKWEQQPEIKIPFSLLRQRGIEYKDSGGNSWLYLRTPGSSDSLGVKTKSNEKTTFIF